MATEGPPLEANAEAIHFLNSLGEPGLVEDEGYTSVERREGRRPRPGPVSLSLILLGLGEVQYFSREDLRDLEWWMCVFTHWLL